MRVWVWWHYAAVVLLLPGAAATPDYFETTVLEDDADYAAQPGLDLTSLGHWTSYFYDSENQVHRGFYLNLCVGFVNLPDAPESTRVHLFATINGSAKEYWADIGFIGSKVVVTDRNTNATANQTSVIFNLPFEEQDLRVGNLVSDIFVATSTEHPVVGRVYHDTMPFDNGDRPSVQVDAPEELGELIVNTTFPFLTLEPSGMLQAESILGLPAQFRVLVTPAEGLRGDVVRFFADVSPGWNLTQNFEYLGPFGEQSREMVFELGRPNATIGEVGRARIDVISNSGAFETLDLVAQVVSGLTFRAERFEFENLDAVQSGQLRDVQVTILREDGSPKPGAQVQLEAHFHGRPMASSNVTADENGTAHWQVRFNRAGIWTVRATLIDEKPTPFVEMQVEVAAPKASPVPALWGSLAVVVVAALLARRRA